MQVLGRFDLTVGRGSGPSGTMGRVNVIDWLLDSDPAIRWQVMRDLTDAPDQEVAAERAKVATEGWGAQLLALQAADGRWGGGTYIPLWTSTTFTLLLLRELGLDPSSEEAQRAIGLVEDNARWEYDDLPFFSGEVEPCINGEAVAIGAYFGKDVRGIVDRLLGDQMADGGWNCEQEIGSKRGSFHSTIDVLDGLLEYEEATGGSAAVRAARLRGQEYLLERRMLRRLSTGEVIDPAFTEFSFPHYFYYDVLRGLDYLRRAAVEPDARAAEAIGIVESKRDDTGRWLLENRHGPMYAEVPVAEGGVHFQIDEGEGKPSRWNTLRAMRVLRWWASAEWPVTTGPDNAARAP